MRMPLFLHTMPQEWDPNLDAKDTKLPNEVDDRSWRGAIATRTRGLLMADRQSPRTPGSL